MKILIPSTVIGEQKKKAGVTYRLFHYIVKQQVEEGILLYNTLTCAMVLVTQEELQNLPAVEGLIENWFLVPEEYNDKRLCKMLRIGTRLKNPQPHGIKTYTILTTTGCNARCSYCFEKGSKTINMSSETAEKVSQFIAKKRGEYGKVKIRWFGGEPLYNPKVMDIICNRLHKLGIDYHSSMTTNGYLFGERMVEKALSLWNLKNIQITIDGTEENYNRIKAFVNTNGKSAYQQVTNNIEHILEKSDIKVSLRVHLDNNNVDDIWQLIKELGERFHNKNNIRIYLSPIFETVGPSAQIRTSNQRQYIYDNKKRIQTYLKEIGFNGYCTKNKLMDKITINRCIVDSGNAVMILPDGHLGLCEHYLESHFFGDIDNDDWNWDVIHQSREYCEELPECETCPYYPQCFRLKICTEHNACFKEWREDNIETIRQQMLDEYKSIKNNENTVL